jgi:TRAP-type C4-dicarboxylate transport system permease small subunit
MDSLLSTFVTNVEPKITPRWRNTVAVVLTVLAHIGLCLLILGATEVFSILFRYMQLPDTFGLTNRSHVELQWPPASVQTNVFAISATIKLLDGLVLAIFVMSAIASVIKLLAHRDDEKSAGQGGVR